MTYVVHRLFSFNDVTFENDSYVSRIKQLKHRVEEVTGVQEQHQTLICRGKWINCDDSLATIACTAEPRVHLHLICSPNIHSPLHVTVTWFEPLGRRQQSYTLQSNNLPIDLSRTIEKDSGVPVEQQCLVVGDHGLTLGQMALLCEYSSNGRDLHVQLRRTCTESGATATVSNRLDKHNLTIKWMDQSSTSLSIDANTSTIGTVKQKLYEEFGLPESS